ncbi:MAG: RNA recognition motif domain-containing protein [Fluviicola sp.]
MTNIFIANLDWEITSEDLQATFSAFGAVHLAHVVFDAKTKQSKGFGYVEMESAEEAINAIQALNGFEVNGRKLDVKIASPKANRPKPEDKPKKPAFSKQGGFQKKFNNNGPRQGGGGGYRSNDRNSSGGSGYNREGGSGNSNYNRGEGGNSNYQKRDGSGSSYNKREDGNSGSSDSNSNSGSGERTMRPRRKFDN